MEANEAAVYHVIVTIIVIITLWVHILFGHKDI